MAAEVGITAYEIDGTATPSDNSSCIYVRAYVTTSGPTYNNSGDTYGTITVNGVEYDIGHPHVPSSSTTTLFEQNIWITHDDDGTKTVSISLHFNLNTTYYGWMDASESLTLTRIGRKSTLSWSGDLTMETSKSFTITRASGDFTHTLSYTFGSASGTIGTSLGSSASWTPPVSLASQVPSSTWGTGTLYLNTYYGTTYIGQNTYSFRLNVPSSVLPSCSVTTSISNAKWNLAVKGISKLNYSISASGSYGSDIKSYAFSFAGQNLSGSSGTTAVIGQHGSLTPDASVTDSRGRSSGVSATAVYVYDYYSPSISSLSCVRGMYSNGSWTANESSGVDLKVTFSVSIASVNENNGVSGTISCTGESDQSFSGTGSKTIYFSTVGTDNTRYITITATDSIGTSVSASITAPTVKVPLNINFGGLSGKDGICIGGVAEIPETFDSRWPVKCSGNISTNGGFLQSTANGNTVTIGSQNASACYFMNSANIPFYFNKNTIIDGNIFPHSTTSSSCGISTYPWANIYANALTLNGSAVNDFVVETGTNNDWFYRKWKSGKQEAWRQVNYGAVAITNAWGSLYESSPLCCSLPTGMFTNVMYQQGSLAGAGGAYVLSLMCGNWNTSSGYTQDMFAIRATPATTTALYVLLYLFGY